MKPKRGSVLPSFISIAAIPLLSSGALSQSLFWAAPVNESGNRDGVWDTATVSWSRSPFSQAQSAWANSGNGVANFTRAEGGTLSATGLTMVRGIRSDTAAPITIEGGLLNFTPASFIIIDNAPLFLNSDVVFPTASLTKSGVGLLAIGGHFTGNSFNIQSGPVSISGNNFADGLQLMNRGVLIMDGDDTIARYTQMSGVLGGSSTLISTDEALIYSGTIAGSLSGNTTIFGDVDVSGTIGGGLLSLQTGTLILSGSSTNSQIDISPDCELLDTNGGLNDADTVLTNFGTLTLNADDTILSYQQEFGGVLAGTGTLTATTGATLNGGSISGNLSANTTINGDVGITGSIGGGSLTVLAGTLTLSGISTNGRIDISSGASLVDSNGGLNGNEAFVFNSGILMMDADDTIQTYTQNTGGVLAGTGTLTVSKAAFLDGGTVSGNLTGTTTSRGDVLVSGNIGGSTLNVQSGTLTLAGTTTNQTINISAGASLVDTSGGLDGTSMSLTNSGNLTLNANDSISGYRQDPGGVLAGAGTLTTTGSAMLFGGTISGNLSGWITSLGDVLVSGTIGGGELTVQKGSLTLTGTSTNSTVRISTGATLFDVNGGLNGKLVSVVNSGTVSLSVNDSIYDYSQGSGELAGTGILSVTKGIFLNGGKVSGNLSGYVTVGGDVLVTGSLSGPSLVVNVGKLSLTGTSSSKSLTINNGTLEVANGGLASDAVVTNGGTFVVQANDTISQFIQNAGHMSGNGVLTVTGGTMLNGGTIEGKLSGNLTVFGNSSVVGQTGGGSLSVRAGTLDLFGTSTHLPVEILTGASVINRNGGLDSLTNVTNRGTLNAAVNDTISTYTQNGGTLAGAGILTVTGAAVLDGALVSGNLSASTVTIGNDTVISGSIGGGSLSVDSGNLTLTGSSTNTTVNISDHGMLTDENGGLNSQANITNQGVLVVNSEQVVSTYTQNPGYVWINSVPRWPIGTPFPLGSGGPIFTESTGISGAAGLLAGTGRLTATNGAILNGGTILGNLWADDTQVFGQVGVEGSMGGIRLTVTDGELTMRGSANFTAIEIAETGRFYGDIDSVNDNTDIINSGYFLANGMDTIGSLVNHGGTVEGFSRVTGATIFNGGSLGDGIIEASGGAILNEGTVIYGELNGNTETFGSVTIAGPQNTIVGRLNGGALRVRSGTLAMEGFSTNALVDISQGATLKNSGNLGDTSHITNFGTLTVNTEDTIGSLSNNGGLVDGSGHLIVSGPALFNGGELAGKLSANSGLVLNNGTRVSGELNGPTQIHGDVFVSGKLGGGTVQIASGSLKLTGSVDSFAHIQQGAGLIGNGRIKSDLLNEGRLTTLSKGDRTLQIDGSLANHGLVSMTVTDAGHHDQIMVGGIASLGGSLLVANNGAGLASGEVATLIKADSFAGGFESFQTLGFENAVIFDDSTGRLIGMASQQPGSAKRYLNLNATQTDVYLSLYEDAVEAGEQNVINGGDSTRSATRTTKAAEGEGTIEFTSGLSDGDAQLVDALNLATFTDPGSIYQPVINRLSPEVHRGMADYTEQATRSHAREAVNAAPVSRFGKTQVFATAHTSMEGVDSSATQAGYDLQMTGFTSGARHDFDKLTRVGGFFGWDDGTIQGALIDTDGHGFVLGAFASRVLDEKRATTLTASLAYGGHDFNATRHSFQGDVSADDIGSEAFEFALGASTTVYQKNRLLVSPNASFRFIDGSVDGFEETGNGVPLRVDGQDIESALFDLGVDVEYKPVDDVTLAGNIGYVKDIGDSDESINASFAASGANGRPFSASAPGIDDDAIVLGLGVYYDLNDRVRASMTYRGDIRIDSQDAHNFGIGLSIGF